MRKLRSQGQLSVAGSNEEPGWMTFEHSVGIFTEITGIAKAGKKSN